MHSTGPGTVYLIHLDTPYKHARHYTGTPESSGFLTGYFAVEGGDCAELAAVLSGLARLRGEAGTPELSRGSWRWPRRPRCPRHRPGSTRPARARR